MYSVVVQLEHWTGPPLALAQLLAPILGVHEDAVATMLKRGPLTVEADLLELEAHALTARLQGLSVPAMVCDAFGQPLDGPQLNDTYFAETVVSEPSSASPPVVHLFEDGDVISEAIDSLFDDTDNDGQASPGVLNGGLNGGWGTVFPDMEQASQTRPQIPSCVAKSTSHMTPASRSKSPLPSKVSKQSPDFGAEQMKESASSALRRPWSSLETLEGTPEVVPEVVPEVAPNQLTSERVLSTVPSSLELHHTLIDAFNSSEDPPYAPTGYDDSAPHSHQIAMVLSLLAPGAGQVYNGQFDRASHYGVWFFLIKPWVDGVRQAKKYGQKVEQYWAPKPPEGSLLRAMRYALVWYGVVSIICVVMVWGATRVYERAMRPPKRDFGAYFLALDGAHASLHDARTVAHKLADARGKEVEKSQAHEDAMSIKERAERLFLVGLEHCQANHYDVCASYMKRVTEYVPHHRDAFRVQTWSKLRLGGAKVPMPKLSKEYGTMQEYTFGKALRDAGHEFQDALLHDDVPPTTQDETK